MQYSRNQKIQFQQMKNKFREKYLSSIKNLLLGFLSASLMAVPGVLLADAQEQDVDNELIEEVIVTARQKILGFGESHANNTVDVEAIQSLSPMNDVLNHLSRLPGVNVTQGDAVGSNDWSTKIFIRGMGNASQIGYMIDEMPNGDSAYGGGQKPNRYTDSENISHIRVAQNAADIGSASNSGLGGTVRYYTNDPKQD